MQSFNKKYDDLYLDILQIGRERMLEGLSFNNLKELLKEKGYKVDNDCIEKAIIHCFLHSYSHYDNDEYEMVNNDLTEFEKHKNCNFILTGVSCLALMNYKNAQSSLTCTKWATIIAVISFLISLISLFA